jgi:hypothetical protein
MVGAVVVFWSKEGNKSKEAPATNKQLPEVFDAEMRGMRTL